MRYIADTDGYVKQVSFGADILCEGDTCTEYTGAVPTGYKSLEAWFLEEAEKLYRWKIVDGNLTLDSTAVAPTNAPLSIGCGGTGGTTVPEVLANLGIPTFITNTDSQGSVVIGNLGIEWGYTGTLNIAANNYAQKSITFTLPFKYVPNVTPALSDSTTYPNMFHCNAYNRTKTGFTFNFRSTYSASTTTRGEWVAIGEVEI